MTETPILLVDDDDALRNALVQSFQLADMAVEAFADGAAALSRLDAGFDGAIISDIRMPRMDGMALFNRVAAIDHEIPVILMTGHGDVPMAVAALRTGAFDFIAKPFATDHLIASARRALEMRRLVLDNRRLRAAADESAGGEPLIGETPAMIRLRENMRQVADADVDILIEGETGTGKELVATLLHRWSRRRGRPFVAINCAALPDAIAEADLFGQETGRAAHSRTTQPGRIARADKGSLFLDEIESSPAWLQGALLRVLEEREILPVGAEQPQMVDLRVIAAAKPGIEASVADGRFRADLLYRLDMVRLRIPPLRERRADVPLLFGYLLHQAADRMKRDVPRIGPDIQAYLADHDWPGNVRELTNFAKRVVLGMTMDGPVDDHLLSLAHQVERFEAGVIRQVLERVQGDARSAMAELQLPRKTFYDKLNRHNIDIDRYRP
ncbi:sigma-54 dependent transcriptional regulator [Sphingobium sp. HBC34]|uniref:Sigma-54 dependent transcriptional regulator n=1 Tax=Sphingobium cyanobacteriorum TaxID=3063954 RepID=A0ABT8ZM50_9SPHN|nr:sigma-54 dependent transcriptional regulator [Sphingobium sp. HBC34]MDO7835619.1 sigma-54 dependent transcriptional regulator [Sphingobium sp. HBC34]